MLLLFKLIFLTECSREHLLQWLRSPFPAQQEDKTAARVHGQTCFVQNPITPASLPRNWRNFPVPIVLLGGRKWGSKADIPSWRSERHQECFHEKLDGSKCYRSPNAPLIIPEYHSGKKGSPSSPATAFLGNDWKKCCSYSFWNEFWSGLDFSCVTTHCGYTIKKLIHDQSETIIPPFFI